MWLVVDQQRKHGRKMHKRNWNLPAGLMEVSGVLGIIPTNEEILLKWEAEHGICLISNRLRWG